MCPDAGGGGDGGPLDADAGSPPDASPGDTGPDSAEVEVGESGDAAEEGPPDAAPDLTPDASPDEMGLDAGDDVQPDAGPDAADGEEPADASDAGDAEDGSTPDVVPVYQAQGGACLCSSSQGPSRSVMGLAVVFVAVLLAHRRRRGRR
jgi:MYXO-CTERM domain-containing protein